MGRRQEQHHPWRRFRELVDWTLHWVDLPEGLLGLTVWESKTVFLTTGMLQVERRCTIAHETAHIEAGPPAPGLRERQELQVRRTTCRRLLPNVHAIADALVWSRGDVHQAADELWVDVATLQDRLEFMTHPAEREILRRRLADADLAP